MSELSSDAMSNVYQFSDRNKSVVRDVSNLYISSEGTVLNSCPILGGKMEKKPGGGGEATRLQEILNFKVSLGLMVNSFVKNNSWQWWYIYIFSFSIAEAEADRSLSSNLIRAME